MPVAIRQLLDLPEVVRKNDFVVSLAGGIEHAARTIETFVVTPNVLHAFDQALETIDKATRSGRSSAGYLHGSFGSGKSHFLAVLTLLLRGHARATARPELHSLVAKYPWVTDAKLVQLPLHMIDAQSLEAKVFETYVHWVKERHPDAPVPPLYRDHELFANAVALRGRMGDPTFFAVLNEGLTAAADGWGDLAAADTWDAARFDAAVASAERKEREALFQALVRTHFPAFAGQTDAFVDLDRGLSALARHAAGLGYRGVVLYLDEFILWLAGRFSNLDFVQTEAQKVAKLVEAQNDKRAIPIVSFIARQRDLSALVGDDVAGVERQTLRDSLEWSSGRFDTITLEDRNLPRIVERRVVKPKDESARQQVEDGFAKLRRSLAGGDWATLLGAASEEADFRRVYPFSPALVEALVDLSDALQRERTAIRLLVELLVEHLPDLALGELVAVGDLYDVLAGGDAPFDGVMRARFQRAHDLYRTRLLPLLHDAHGTGTKARCQRLNEGHSPRLGCSGCPETACRNDNRLAKTLLLAALVPESRPFKDLTVRRLVQLNHGSVTTFVPGEEVSTAAARLRSWATQIGQLRVGDQADPTVSLRLEGVDLGPILESARGADNAGARKRVLQRLLFAAAKLGDGRDSTVTRSFTWRGTKRPGRVRFVNVRELSPESLRCPADAEWQIVIDYPFDVDGHTPEDDLHVVERYRDSYSAEPNPTFVWLPTFFATKLERELGDLVVVEHVLAGDNPRKYLANLRPDDQQRARQDLESLRNQKDARIRRALREAYGVGQALLGVEGDLLDPSRAVDDHVVSLHPDLDGKPLNASDFADALDQLAERLLDKVYPHHPRLGSDVTAGKLEKVIRHVERMLEASDRRVRVDKSEQSELLHLAAPLGVASLGETSAQLGDGPLRAMERQRQQAGVETPSVEQVRRYADPDGHRGLTREVADALVIIYALWDSRVIEHAGRPVPTLVPGKLADGAELVKPELPTETEWETALSRAGQLFGITFPGKARSVRNVEKLAEALRDQVAAQRYTERLPEALAGRLERWGDGSDAPRLVTARSGAALIGSLRAGRSVDLVRALARFVPETSAEALQRGLLTAEKTWPVVSTEGTWMAFDTVGDLAQHEVFGGRAGEILDELRRALAADELVVPLRKTIDALTQRAIELRDAWKKWKPGGHGDSVVRMHKVAKAAAKAEIPAKLAALAATLVAELGDVPVRGEISLTVTLAAETAEEPPR